MCQVPAANHHNHHNVFLLEEPGPLGVWAAPSIPELSGNRQMVNLLRNRKCLTQYASLSNLAPISHQPQMQKIIQLVLTL